MQEIYWKILQKVFILYFLYPILSTLAQMLSFDANKQSTE